MNKSSISSIRVIDLGYIGGSYRLEIYLVQLFAMGGGLKFQTGGGWQIKSNQPAVTIHLLMAVNNVSHQNDVSHYLVNSLEILKMG